MSNEPKCTYPECRCEWGERYCEHKPVKEKVMSNEQYKKEASDASEKYWDELPEIVQRALDRDVITAEWQEGYLAALQRHPPVEVPEEDSRLPSWEFLTERGFEYDDFVGGIVHAKLAPLVLFKSSAHHIYYVKTGDGAKITTVKTIGQLKLLFLAITGEPLPASPSDKKLNR